MPLWKIDPGREARETLRAELNRQEDVRASRRGAAYVTAAVVLWVSGTAMTYSSFAVVGDDLGNVLLWGGMSLGNIGPFFVWVAWVVSGTNRGEW
jgi:hypothetical protein